MPYGTRVATGARRRTRRCAELLGQACKSRAVASDLNVDAVLQSIEVFRAGGRPPAEVLRAAGVGGVDDAELARAVLSVLQHRPDMIAAWQGWSWDKRWSPSPYLDGLEVGHYDGGRTDVRLHTSAASACTDFVVAEVRWLVECRVTANPF